MKDDGKFHLQMVLNAIVKLQATFRESLDESTKLKDTNAVLEASC